jgi:hypothetical protein
VAVAELRQAIRLRAGSGRAHARLVVKLYAPKDPAWAAAEAREAMRLGSDVAGHLNDLALRLLAADDLAGTLLVRGLPGRGPVASPPAGDPPSRSPWSAPGAPRLPPASEWDAARVAAEGSPRGRPSSRTS